MKLLVIILCLLSERYLMHSWSYKRFFWFDAYCNKLRSFNANTTITNSWVKLAFLILPLLLIVSILYLLIHGIFFGFIGFLLNLLILFYCIGPENPFYPSLDDSKNQNEQVSSYLARVNRQLFAVLFWYPVGGPIAALIYRLITLSISVNALSAEAQVATDILEWIPTRMTILLYLIVGNFQPAYPSFIQLFITKPALNHNVLTTCSVLALQSEAEASNEVSITVAENLVVQACIALLVFVALITLVMGLR